MEKGLRNLIVQFYNDHLTQSKAFTVQHFVAEGVSKRTVYNILKNLEDRGNVERMKGSGRPANIMTERCKAAFSQANGIKNGKQSVTGD